jgi:hypothetical protein
MPTTIPQEQRQPTQSTGYFAETAVGTVVLVAVQFLSLPVLIGGLTLIGLAKLLSKALKPS